MTAASPLESVEYARQRVDELIVSEKLDVVATDVWNEIRFDDGWLLVSVREGVLGARYFLAMDSGCLLYTSPSPRDATLSRMPSSA